MNEIKISVSVTLPGNVMLTPAEAAQLEKNKEGAGYDSIKVSTGGKGVKVIKVKKTKPISQSINMYKEAYEYMTSKDSCPPNIKPFVWVKMKPIKRLEAHLELICKHLGGDSFTYQVFDD